MTGYSERYEAALTLAAQAHRDQVRKIGDVPYIVHPVHVSVILLRHGFSEDAAIAGLLHDAVEDQGIALSRIEAEFGPTVAGMVAALTERKQEDGSPRPWEARRRELLEQVSGASQETVAVKAADSIHSARDLAMDLRLQGPTIWGSFSGGPDLSLRFFQDVASLVRERLGAHPLADELDEAVNDLERAIIEAGNS